MRTYFFLIFCLFFLATLQTAQAQTCNDHISASTPNSQLVDNGNGTVTDSRTRLMWKKCVEGKSGSNCESGSAAAFTWQTALQRPRVTNNSSGFAGYHDWRLPNIKELRSIVEEKCVDPAINLTRFPNAWSEKVWSGSLYAAYSNYAWYVHFYVGDSDYYNRDDGGQVRLVRGGQ
jgi:hypothetical protein